MSGARLTEHERGARDLAILALLDKGVTQAEAARRFGLTRGAIVNLTTQIRQNEARG